MKQTRQKPMVGDLVRIDKEYPNTQAAGQLAVVVKTLGIECVVQPTFSTPFGKPWWFSRKHLEIVNAGR
jgi:hypothetical protein